MGAWRVLIETVSGLLFSSQDPTDRVACITAASPSVTSYAKVTKGRPNLDPHSSLGERHLTRALEPALLRDEHF